jgi:hypothetical protein
MISSIWRMTVAFVSRYIVTHLFLVSSGANPMLARGRHDSGDEAVVSKEETRLMTVETLQRRRARSRSLIAGLTDRWALAALGVALGSRLLVAAVCLVAARLFTAQPVNPALRYPAVAEAFRGTLGEVLDPLAHYDGVWFLHVAVSGYPAGQNATFFPLYPLAVRAVALLADHRYELAGIAVSTACFLVAALLLYSLVEREVGRRAALCTIAFLALFPTSFFFQAVYSESLLLVLSLACFWFLRRDRLVLAGVAALLATLTRVTGVLLLVPMAMTYFGGGKAAARRGGARAAALLLPPLGLLGYCLYLWRVGGDPVAWSTQESEWGRQLTSPLTTVWHATRAAWYAVRYIAVGKPAPLLQAYPGQAMSFVQHEIAVVNLISFLALVFAAWALVVGWRRLPRSWTVYAAALIVVPLLQPRAQIPLMSMPRFVLCAFPLFASLGLATERRRTLRTVLLIGSSAALVYLTGRFALWLFVA